MIREEGNVIYCTQCGAKNSLDARFCQKCGTPIKLDQNTNSSMMSPDYRERKSAYAGRIIKCPSCGESLKSFEVVCPACGHELRAVSVTSSVKEFALKLEEIGAQRESEKRRGFFSRMESLQRVSTISEQKIGIIKNFVVPNTKEDMLEFMILATSNINMAVYDSTNPISKDEKALNDAWLAKVHQVYEKAKRINSTDGIFKEIKELYDDCNENIRSAKKKCILKWCLMFAWIPLTIIISLIVGALT